VSSAIDLLNERFGGKSVLIGRMKKPRIVASFDVQGSEWPESSSWLEVTFTDGTTKEIDWYDDISSAPSRTVKEGIGEPTS
jgi:hypothetical protein